MNELPQSSLPRISSIPGPRGPKGDKGDSGDAGAAGVSPQATLTAPFIMPAAAGTVTVTVTNTSWTATGLPVYIETAGSFIVAAILSATSLSITAQAATDNAAAGTTIATGKKVVPGARMTSDTTQIDSLGVRVTALESGNAAGNKSWFGATQPVNTGGVLKVGDIFFDSSQNNKIYRWDGTQWVDVQKVLDLPDFGLGIRPIVKVQTLPASGYNNGDFVWLETDGKLYRRVNGAWTKAVGTGDLVGQIDGTMIVDGSLVAQKIAANAITADKVGANQIITDVANIGEGIITDAHIGNLSAGKITAGDIQTVNIGYAGRLFHPLYHKTAAVGGAERYFRAVEFGTSFASGHMFTAASGFTFSHGTPVTAYGPGHGSWGLNNAPTMSPNSSGAILVNLQGRLIGYTGNITLYARVDGGSFFALAARSSQDGADAIIDANRILTGLTPASRIEIFVAPCDGNGAILTNVTCRYEVDAVFYNW